MTKATGKPRGRPRRHPDTALGRHQVNLALTAAEHEEFKRIAAAQNITLSQLVRLAVLAEKGTIAALEAERDRRPEQPRLPLGESA